MGEYWWIPWTALGIFILLLFCFAVIWAFRKRQSYMKEIEGKHKGIFLPQGSIPYTKIMEILPDGQSVNAPEGHMIKTYMFAKESTWYMRYPDNPPLGIKWVQVQVPTSYWAENDPNPIVPKDAKPVATADQIFSSGDTRFIFALREAKAELDAERRAIMKKSGAMINPMAVYILLIVAIVAIGVVGYLSYKDSSLISSIAEKLGIAVK